MNNLGTKKLLIFIILLPLFSFTFYFQTNSPEQSNAANEAVEFRSDNLYQWGSISSFHGLPSEKINSIAQTQDGLLWFGTEKGLAKFDGRRVQTITSQNLSSVRILSLRVSANGDLWIGTENGAFRSKNDVYFPIEETRNLAINAIYSSEKSENMFLASEKGLVFEGNFNSESGVSFKQISSEESELKTLSRFENTTVIGTHKRGLLGIEGEKAKEFATKPRNPFINTFAKDLNGELWVGTEIFSESSGLYRAKTLSDWERIDAAVGSVTSLSFDHFGNLWVGTKDRGAFKFRDGKQIQRFTFANTAGGLRSDEILTTFVDRENVVWFGSNKGICRFDQGSPLSEEISDDKQSNFIRTLYETKSGKLLAGTNRGLFFKDPLKGWSEIEGFESNPIYAISENESGLLLIGAANGFFYDVDLTARTRTSFLDNEFAEWSEKESIRDIEIFKEKTYVAFFGRGVAEFSSGVMNFPKNSREMTGAISLHSPNDEVLWVGTSDKGVFLFDGADAKQIPELDSLNGRAIWTITGDAESGIWIGTEKGLFRFENGELQKVLADHDVRNVLVVSEAHVNTKTIWCATIEGLIQIKSDPNFGWIVSSVDVDQGLSLQSAFTILKSGTDGQDTSILFGTNRGIANYRVNRIRPLIIPTRILSKRLHSIAESENENGIEVEYPQNSLAVEVSALSSRTFPEQFQYSFLLRNENGELINKRLSNDSQFLMDNLRSGKYSVEIQAYDKDLTSSEPLTINFSIAGAPFPWTTLALTVLLFLAIVALIWAGFSQRRISRTSSELALANRELNTARLDLANEAERERRRISRDLHDQTLADLRHLLLMTDRLSVNEESREQATIFRSEIESVSGEIRNICEDLSPSVLENIGFTASLEWALSNAVRDSEKIITSEFVCPDFTDQAVEFPSHVQIQIYRIVQEVLSNIGQHSLATSIKVSVRKPFDKAFSLEIVDNGQFFQIDSKLLKKGRGLTNIQSRANLIGAEATWSVNQDRATVFTLIVG